MIICGLDCSTSCTGWAIFDNNELLEGQASIELSQDIGTANRIYNEGDSLFLEVNPKKINVFTEDGEENLVKGSEN